MIGRQSQSYMAFLCRTGCASKHWRMLGQCICPVTRLLLEYSVFTCILRNLLYIYIIHMHIILCAYYITCILPIMHIIHMYYICTISCIKRITYCMYMFCVLSVQAQQSTKGLLAALALPPAALPGQLHQATILCCCSLHSTKPSNFCSPVNHVAASRQTADFLNFDTRLFHDYTEIQSMTASHLSWIIVSTTL